MLHPCRLPAQAEGHAAFTQLSSAAPAPLGMGHWHSPGPPDLGQEQMRL